ncbi:MAG: SusD/RagB family nutrient-binding outer membrane lipoprotein [Bacteroidetes bacterium]|nr:SusD/RagB family nutrient-binding outer membrane lipoprotein [Bacteroidota bacterium]
MKKYILIIAAFFAAGITGCKKDYLSLEVNPNTPSVTTPGLTLAAALNASAAIVSTGYPQYGVWSGYYTTSGNYVPNQSINQYQFTNTSFSGDWTAWYANLTNYNNLVQISAADPKGANYQAIGLVMEAYGFSHLVDNYEDVPYTQAFQASKILYPAYDKGPAIYADLFKKIDQAIGLMGKAGATVPGSDDIVFHGDMGKWKQFANSLKLRMAIRVSGVQGFDAKAIMATTATTADPSDAEANFLGETTSAISNPGYVNATGKQNPFYAAYGADPTGNPAGSNVYYRANAFSVNLLSAFNDPRLTELYTQVPTSGSDATLRVHGNTFGDTKTTLLSNSFTSAVGPGLLQSPTQGQPLMWGSEALFLQAEAVNKGYLTGNAQDDYEGGITASFLELGLTAADAQTYYSQDLANVSWTASPNKEQAIITQKWIALNGYFQFEAWNEYRRTGYPVLPSSIDPAAISTTLPTRVPYPLSELTTNGANLAKEGTINYFTSKIFWAK